MVSPLQLDASDQLASDRYEVLYLSDSKLTPRWFYKGLMTILAWTQKFCRGDARRQLHQQLEIIKVSTRKR